ncbi:hypothetical protein A4R26_24185 [Niastella populi]|uniref:PKD domain-containing protein n=1 Tax=Niastella populi TaxID=550983 RepID=A0A1V9FGJ8_9BACT|nr:hypothetical protein A4R26_24185 [Niastella populi]
MLFIIDPAGGGAGKEILQYECATGKLQRFQDVKVRWYKNQVMVHPVPHAAFQAPVFCLPGGTGRFLNTSTFNNNAALASQWIFGDGNTAAETSPVHRYNNVGPYSVTLTVTSPDGCVDDSSLVINSIYSQASLQYAASPENCLGDSRSL